MKLEINGKTVSVRDFSTDSRKIKKGDLFIAYRGINNDLHDFILDAIKNGAKVVAGERSLESLPEVVKNSDIKYFQVKDGREFWAESCARKYGNPEKKLKTIGVTGTDGKTTTCTLVYEILKASGKRAGLISTVGVKYEDKKNFIDSHTTTPPSDILFKLLKDMADDGIEYVVIEVSSHGLVQKRVHGIHFSACGVTNITPEHLDLHGSYESLIKDKSLIFKASDAVFLNKNGIGIDKIKKFASRVNKIFEVELEDKVIKKFAGNSDFKAKFPGRYNLQNAALALEIARYLGVSDEDIYTGVVRADPPEGRFQYISNKKGVNIIVDFAHTENALKNVLRLVKSIKEKGSSIITVFGCAGERDKLKRPKMGKAASELSDIVILTSEDPRSENPKEIIADIVSGSPKFPFIIETDRKKVIEKAVGVARKGDWVLILGKGHERSMNIGGEELPWSDFIVAQEILSQMKC